jgi:hypothetical protein
MLNIVEIHLIENKVYILYPKIIYSWLYKGDSYLFIYFEVIWSFSRYIYLR